ncbi:MAG: hypothetical protein WCA77_00930 [Thermoplasmata archaeon]
MPGAPNRPPEVEAPPAPAPVSGTTPAQRVLRRLAPSRVALRLDVWKGAPHNDLLTPFEKAEALFAAGDFPGAEGALDQLSVRFAEPRWPTMPSPFRELRVSIPAPQPPHWDPENSLAAPEKEARRSRKDADRQFSLARGSIEWARAHTVSVDDLAEPLRVAEQALAETGPTDPFWSSIDTIWAAVHERVPAPARAPARPSPTPPPAAAESVEEA